MCETKENPLGTEHVGRLLRSYAIPGIISMVINSLYNMVDQIFIGQGVGMLGNGATNIIAPISTIAIALSSLFGDGLATYFILNSNRNQTNPTTGASLLCVSPPPISAYSCVGTSLIRNAPPADFV